MSILYSFFFSILITLSNGTPSWKCCKCTVLQYSTQINLAETEEWSLMIIPHGMNKPVTFWHFVSEQNWYGKKNLPHFYIPDFRKKYVVRLFFHIFSLFLSILFFHRLCSSLPFTVVFCTALVEHSCVLFDTNSSFLTILWNPEMYLNFNALEFLPICLTYFVTPRLTCYLTTILFLNEKSTEHIKWCK